VLGVTSPISQVDGILKLCLAAPAIYNHYNVQTSLCQHFVEALSRNSPLVLLSANVARILFGSAMVVELLSSTTSSW
jgi:hypothetical protein